VRCLVPPAEGPARLFWRELRRGSRTVLVQRHKAAVTEPRYGQPPLPPHAAATAVIASTSPHCSLEMTRVELPQVALASGQSPHPPPIDAEHIAMDPKLAEKFT
jgi:hypothetical protein